MQVFAMVGVTDAHIAHEPFDMDYVRSWRPGHDKGDGLYILGKHPDFIQLVARLTSPPLEGVDDWGKQYKSVFETWNAPEFRRLYRFYPVQVEGKRFYNLYRLQSKAQKALPLNSPSIPRRPTSTSGRSLPRASAKRIHTGPATPPPRVFARLRT
jgi:hypothetical protein